MTTIQGAIGIPACNEGETIVFPLYSIAVQKNVSLKDWPVYITVNNPANASASMKQNNAISMDILRCCVQGRVSDKLSCKSVEFRSLDPHFPDGEDTLRISPVKAMKIIISRGLHIHPIDCFSEGNTRDGINVGKARDIAFRKAIQAYPDNGNPHLLSTDADTLLCSNYLQHATQHYGGNGLCIGPIISMMAGSNAQQRQRFESALIVWNMAAIVRTLQIQTYLLDIDPHHNIASSIACDLDLASPYSSLPDGSSTLEDAVSGQNIYLDRETYEKAGGMPHEAGDEDTIFARSVLESSMDITYDPHLIVRTMCDFSSDTSTGNGKYFGRGAQYSDNMNAFPVISYTGRKCMLDLIHWIQEQRGSSLTKKNLRKQTKKNSGKTITRQEARTIIEASDHDIHLENTLRDIVQKYFPLSLRNAISEIESLLLRPCLDSPPKKLEFFHQLYRVLQRHSANFDTYLHTRGQLHHTNHENVELRRKLYP